MQTTGGDHRMTRELSPKENYLEAIRFGSPQYVPRWDEGVDTRFQFADIVRRETWTDRWGVGWVLELEDTVPFPKRNPLSDITRVDEFEFPDPDTLTMSEETLEKINRTEKSKHLRIGSMAYFVFERAWALTGMENLLVAMVEYPEETRYLLHRIADYARRVFTRYLDLGLDGVTFSEDLGSQRALMMSPSHFREFLLPEYEHALSNVIACGKIVNFHSCGCVEEVAGDLADLGITILNPVQARANDLQRVKEATRGKTALSGAVDTDLILRGTPEAVHTEALRVLGIMKTGGGYIFGPDQGFPHFPPENIAAIHDAWEELGRY
jgi:uroporphyrinogen decarboxylase